MPTFEKFTGINNVLPTERLPESDLAVATDVDFGLSGEILRRAGYARTVATDHRNVWDGSAYTLATCAGDLTSILPNGTRTVVSQSLGSDRVWYLALPDGRIAFSNGLITGIVSADGLSSTGWGIPVPESIGALTPVAGALFPGDYQYQITYVRLSDGQEGGPQYSNPITVSTGGILLTGLPVRAGYGINVYLTSHNGGDAHLAGFTTTASFSYLGKNDGLVIPCRTDFVSPPPAGTVSAFWRGRALVAVGSMIIATRVHQVERFDARSDFLQFPDAVTMIQPVDSGVYVGTKKSLFYLAGAEFEKLAITATKPWPVVLGSGVAVPGELVKQGDGVGQGSAMICIADGFLVAGFNDGQLIRLTEGRYSTVVTEVSATFRTVNGIPQYLAVPR
ncbi:hypothetical protein PSQ40_04950 [Curvibacter sp. HBC61]|uniref:Uncharacterized protein n=1 Tax=Curvibacter cyanobacteriorum TaxID=3026422 RepID=A0ABT5MV42_9BURK|nr:hypothetical protein [Curvibacter sp. HBC61]MDD0837914.1 hypothetical protein [Curvibacter sp. HBC61]